MSGQGDGISISVPQYDDPKSGDQVGVTWSGTSAPVTAEEGSAGAGEAADGIQRIPARIQAQESPTVAVARERLVEAIGREAAFLADQRAGQASEALESLARAFALVTTGTPMAIPAASGAADGARVSSFSEWGPSGKALSVESGFDAAQQIG
ncbi:hypothetical protein [Streptomyces sp. NPDC049949]|uniref:hypothetical protein n=1 Tax=Streptomyces sp. NPDC049949 TaxID=3154627 RepID=UPI00343A7642